ncbi:MAG: PQQ-binding-like beta-propeller repeat protein [Planctomycetaceae bacterium]|nr:PQQ-binding-like beta-propeller repeat protein [Planctomycetaceae bacterium]
MMRVLTLAIWGLCTATVVAGENWSQFRGPHGDGRSSETGLPVEFGETKNVAWNTPVRGRAWSSPVVWDKQIWLTSASEDGRELYGICVDLDSGSVLFDHPIFQVAEPLTIHKFNSYASPTPVIEAGRVYLSWGSSGLACLDTNTFERVWVRRDLECNHFRGAGSSPILHHDLLILPYDGYDYQYVVALDKATGDTVWKVNRPHNFGTDNGDQKKAYGTAHVIEVNGTPQLIVPTSKGAFAYDPETGDEIWRVRYNGFSTAARPLYADGVVYLSSGFSKSELLAVDPTGTGDVTDTHVHWLEPKAMPSKPSPLYVAGRIFVIEDKGVASCLNAETGENVWQARVGGNYSASPILAEGRIYFASEEGKVTVIAAKDEYEVLTEAELESGVMSSPAVADKSLLVRTNTHLYRFRQAGPETE